MTDTDILYMASLEKRNAELEAKVAELEDKHWNECRQIAHYSDENAKLKELLRKAVEDFPDLTDMWRYADEALALIGEDTNVPAADVQPVKRGRWIKAQDKQGSYFLCSNCGTAEKTESDQDGTVWQHDEYCRKCGARMDGEQND